MSDSADERYKYNKQRHDMALSSQKLETERARARLLNLAFEQRRGKVADVELVERMFFNALREIRDIYMAAPARFSALGAVRLRCDEQELFNFIDEMIRECCQQAAHVESIKIDGPTRTHSSDLLGTIEGTGTGDAAERITVGGSKQSPS